MNYITCRSIPSYATGVAGVFGTFPNVQFLQRQFLKCTFFQMTTSQVANFHEEKTAFTPHEGSIKCKINIYVSHFKKNHAIFFLENTQLKNVLLRKI